MHTLLGSFVIFIDELMQAVEIALHPRKNTTKPMKVSEALGFYFRLSVIPAILYMIISALFMNSSTSIVRQISYLSSFGVFGVLIFGILLFWVINPLALLLGAAVYHFFGKTLFQSFKKKYSGTLTALTYAVSPGFLLTWLTPIPLLGLAISAIGGVWSLVVTVIATSNQQKVTVLNAFAVYLIEIVVLGFIAFLIALVVILSMLPSTFIH